MARESTLNHRVTTALRKIPVTLVDWVENSCCVGTPDMCVLHNGVYAWVENKHLPAWPKRPATPVRVAHFSWEQKLWLLLHGEAGGLGWLFIQVDDDYLLFDWRWAQVIDTHPKAVWLDVAAWKGKGRSCDWLSWVKVVTGQ